MACLMVVSTFIISRPLVDVHAVEAINDGYLDLTPVFDGTSLFDTTGNVELVGYKRDTGIYRDGLKVTVSGSNWYVLDTNLKNSGSVQRLWGGPVNGAPNYAGGHHFIENDTVGDGIGSALIFTSPRQGKYEFNYSQTIDWAGTFGCGVELRIEDADGNVLDSASGTTDKATLTVNATLYLNQGDVIYIIRCPLAKDGETITTENRSTNGVASFSIAQLDNYPDIQGESLDMTPVFDGTSFFDTTGNVELVGYHRDTGIYREGLEMSVSGTAWYVLDTKLTNSGSLQRLWKGTVDGALDYAGGHHNTGQLKNDNFTHTGDGIGSALIFTAPRFGQYEFKFTLNSGWAGSNKCGIDLFIWDEDGIVVDTYSTTSSQINMEVTATVYLKRGEKLYIARCPQKYDDVTILSENISCNGVASVSITQLDYVSCDNGCILDRIVPIDRVEPDSHLVPGYAAHYECVNCGKLWADENATVPTTLEELAIVMPFTEPEKDGRAFGMYNRYISTKSPAAPLQTVEAWIKIAADASDERLYEIYSNYVDAYTHAVSLEIAANGVPRLWWQQAWNKCDDATFTEVDVRTGEWLHLTVTRDIVNKTASCYINGELVQTVAFTNGNDYIETTGKPMCIGGAYTANNNYWFRQGFIHSVASFSDIRTADEIKSDYENGIVEAGTDLLGYYIVSPKGNERLLDYSTYQNHLTMTNQAMTSVEEVFVSRSSAPDIGMKFNWDDLYTESAPITVFPRTLEATVLFSATTPSTVRGGIIYGNYAGAGTVASASFEINTNGNPRICFTNDSGSSKDFIFNNVNVYNGKTTKLAVVINTDSVVLYVDGEAAQTISSSGIGAFVDGITLDRAMLVGGDYRARNTCWFKGQLLDLALYSDVRTADEIASDVTSYGTDDALIGLYEFASTDSYPETIADGSANGNDLEHINYFYQTDMPTDFAYSLLLLGDTQYVNERYPENFSKIYDWIIANTEKHKIKYLLGLGDITDKDNEYEWARAKTQFARLDGILPYSLVRGNHDTSEGINGAFNTEAYNATFDGKFGDGIESTYRTLTIGKVNYLIMTLDFGCGDDVIEWANEVIAAHPHHNVIITTHAYLKSYGAGLLVNGDSAAPSSYDSTYNDADVLWDNLISKHANISFVISGHVSANTVHVVDAVGDNGNVVKQILVNPQDIDAFLYGGTGMVTLLYFNEDGSEMEIRTYSTAYGGGDHLTSLVYDPSVNAISSEHNYVNGVCSICNDSCTHDWTGADGVCNVCEMVCEHDLKVVSGKSVCNTCGYTYNGIYVKHISNLTIDKPYDDPFFIGGYDIENKNIWGVEDAPRVAWSYGGSTYYGNWLLNGEAYVTTNPEDANDPTIIFDMTPNNSSYGSVVGFVAPADGVFNVKAEFRKVWGGITKIALMKEDGTELWTTNIEGNNATAVIDVEGIELFKDEKLIIVVTKVSGSSANTGFRSFSVEAVYYDCPHSYGDDNVCDYCGYDCTADIAEDKFGEVFDSVFTEGATTDHVATGPVGDELADSGAIAGTNVENYLGFNLEMVGKTSNIVKLRHHILLTAGQEVLVDGKSVELTNVSGNYYYFEVEVEVGKLATAHTVTVDGETVVIASVHSYMKTAFEKDAKDDTALTNEEENLLRALYDWDKAVADANANA